MMGLGLNELLVILGIVIILFGGSKLPLIGKGLGEAISNFKKGLKKEDPPLNIDATRDSKKSEGNTSRDGHPLN